VTSFLKDLQKSLKEIELENAIFLFGFNLFSNSIPFKRWKEITIFEFELSIIESDRHDV